MCNKKNINTVFNIKIKEIPKIYTVQNLKKEETITLKMEWNTKIIFQMETGANVNVLPLTEYIRVTNDVNGKFIKKINTRPYQHMEINNGPLKVNVI